jgi:hypothetical protein
MTRTWGITLSPDLVSASAGFVRVCPVLRGVRRVGCGSSRRKRYKDDPAGRLFIWKTAGLRGKTLQQLHGV